MPLFGGPPNVGKLKAKRNIKGLINALGYKKDWGIRRDAAEALRQIGDARAVEPLIAALKDKSPVREAAAGALEDLGWQPDKSETGGYAKVPPRR
jgi:HEAT repeat protein